MKLGPYEVRSEIGRGGMGRVCRAIHLPTGVERAVKLIAAPNDLELVERFEREAKVLARTAGRGVVTVHESGIEGRTFWYAMDVMRGGSLAARLEERGGKLPWREACTTILALARALERCHAAGVVHRDLKPDNVLFGDSGEPCIADFGCARDLQASAITLAGTVMGTPAYMAPEQLSGLPAGPAADVFSLGVMLHELVTGQRPFAGATITDLLLAVSSGSYPKVRDWGGAPSSLPVLIANALEPDPARRVPDGGAFARELSALLEGQVVEPRQPATRGRGAFVGGLLVLLVLGGALGAAWFARDPRSPAAPPAPVVPSHPAAATGSPSVTPPASNVAELERASAARLVSRAELKIGRGYDSEMPRPDVRVIVGLSLDAIAAARSASGAVPPERLAKIEEFLRHAITLFVVVNDLEALPLYLRYIDDRETTLEIACEVVGYLGMHTDRPGVAPRLLAHAQFVLDQPDVRRERRMDAYEKKARALKQLGRAREGEAVAVEAVSLYPDSIRFVLGRAVYFCEDGRHKEALAFLAPYVDDANAEDALKLIELRADCFLKVADYQGALAELQRVRKGEALHSGGWCTRGECQFWLGDREGAIQSLVIARKGGLDNNTTWEVTKVESIAKRLGLELPPP